MDLNNIKVRRRFLQSEGEFGFDPDFDDLDPANINAEEFLDDAFNDVTESFEDI